MRAKHLRWCVSGLFWIPLAGSLGLAKHFPWLDTVWYLGLALILFGLSAYSVLLTLQHHPEGKGLTYQDYPRWFARFAHDEDPDDSARTPPRGPSSR